MRTILADRLRQFVESTTEKLAPRLELQTAQHRFTAAQNARPHAPLPAPRAASPGTLGGPSAAGLHSAAALPGSISARRM